MGRGLSRLVCALLVAGLPLLSVVGGLVGNEVAGDSHWPWGLDVARRHPWATLSITAVVSAVGAVVVWWWPSKDSGLSTGSGTSPVFNIWGGTVRVESITSAPMRGHPDEVANEHSNELDEHTRLNAAGTAKDGRTVGPRPRVWNVRQRTAAFTGREQMLMGLRQQLGKGGPVVVQALHGWGGVGKTTLALEYAHRFADSYDLVWWIDAERVELIGDQMGALGVAAGWVGVEVPTDQATATVTDRLRNGADWLMVFDNAMSPADIVGWMPQGSGHVIVTSRHSNWEQVAAPLGVDVFARAESVALLRRLGATPSPQLADEISARLGDLPLAVTQAGLWMAATGLSGVVYLAELDRHAAAVMSLGHPVDYPMPLAASVRTAADKVGNEDGAAMQLLRLCAALAPEPVPLDLLITATSTHLLPPSLRATATSPLALGKCVVVLARYGLARASDDGPYMHRLTRAVLLDWLDPDARTELSALAAQLLVAARPNDVANPSWWPNWARLLPHLLALDPANSTNRALRQLAERAAFYLLSRGDQAAGTTLARQLYKAALADFGHDDLDTLQAAHVLAYAHRLSSNHGQAHALDEETFARRRRILSTDHPDTLVSADHLAFDLNELGRTEEALVLGDDTLKRHRQVLGDDDPGTLGAAHNLARYLGNMGRLNEALALNKDTFARRQRVLGHDHLNTLRSAASLALDLYRLRRLKEALALSEDTLSRMRRVLGEDHPLTQNVAHNLALILRVRKRAGVRFSLSDG